MLGLTVSALGIRLSALSMENGKINRTATMPQSRTFTHFGAFFRQNRNIRTAITIQLAAMLRLTISETARSRSLPLSDTVDHLLHLVELIIGEILPSGKGGDKRGERAFKFLFHQLVDLPRLRLVL